MLNAKYEIKLPKYYGLLKFLYYISCNSKTYFEVDNFLNDLDTKYNNFKDDNDRIPVRIIRLIDFSRAEVMKAYDLKEELDVYIRLISNYKPLKEDDMASDPLRFLDTDGFNNYEIFYDNRNFNLTMNLGDGLDIFNVGDSFVFDLNNLKSKDFLYIILKDAKEKYVNFSVLKDDSYDSKLFQIYLILEYVKFPTNYLESLGKYEELVRFIASKTNLDSTPWFSILSSSIDINSFEENPLAYFENNDNVVYLQNYFKINIKGNFNIKCLDMASGNNLVKVSLSNSYNLDRRTFDSREDKNYFLDYKNNYLENMSEVDLTHICDIVSVKTINSNKRNNMDNPSSSRLRYNNVDVESIELSNFDDFINHLKYGGKYQTKFFKSLTTKGNEERIIEFEKNGQVIHNGDILIRRDLLKAFYVSNLDETKIYVSVDPKVMIIKPKMSIIEDCNSYQDMILSRSLKYQSEKNINTAYLYRYLMTKEGSDLLNKICEAYDDLLSGNEADLKMTIPSLAKQEDYLLMNKKIEKLEEEQRYLQGLIERFDGKEVDANLSK